MEHLADAPIANILILAGVIFLAVGLFGRVGGFIGSIFGNIEAGKNSRVLAGVLGVLLIVGGGWLHEQSDKSAVSTSGPAAPVTTASNTATGTPAPSAAPAITVKPPTTAPTAAPATPATAANHKATPNAASDPGQPRAPVPAAREKLPASAPAAVFDDRLVGIWTNLTTQLDNVKRIEFARVGQNLDAHVWHNCPSGDCDVGRFPVTISGTAPGFEYNSNGRRSVGTLNLYSPAVLLLTMDLTTPTGGHSRRNWVMIESTIPDKIRGGFSRYFTKPQHRAFAITPSGYWSYQFNAKSLDHAEEGALKACNKHGEAGCRIILVDDDAK